MRKKKILDFRVGENEKEIIKFVGLGVLVLSSIVFPGLPIALKPFLNKRGKQKFQSTIKKMDEKGVIYLHGDRVKLSKKGLDLLRKIQTQDIEISKPDKWDGLWYLVSYDIPEYLKKERDWFRSNLKRLDFKQIQKSLWVYPYNCQEEIAVIAQSIKVSPYVIVMTTYHLPQQQKLERHFGFRD